jgi:hypothetical protein
VRYELNSYILFGTHLVFNGLNDNASNADVARYLRLMSYLSITSAFKSAELLLGNATGSI